MKLEILASGSSGNCYLLENETELLILEAGIPFRRIQEGINFNVGKAVGCLVTHEHKDHSKSIMDILKNGINVYTSKGTIEALGMEESYRLKTIKST